VHHVNGKLVFWPTKNYRNRTIVLPRFLREPLDDHLVDHAAPGADGLSFTAASAAPLRNSNFSRRVWQPVVADAGLPKGLRIHDLRHTAIALLTSQGAHPEAIKRYTGHSSIAVTMDIHGRAPVPVRRRGPRRQARRAVARFPGGQNTENGPWRRSTEKGRNRDRRRHKAFRRCPRQDSNLRHPV
jgi:integrase